MGGAYRSPQVGKGNFQDIDVVTKEKNPLRNYVLGIVLFKFLNIPKSFKSSQKSRLFPGFFSSRKITSGKMKLYHFVFEAVHPFHEQTSSEIFHWQLFEGLVVLTKKQKSYLSKLIILLNCVIGITLKRFVLRKGVYYFKKELTELHLSRCNLTGEIPNGTLGLLRKIKTSVDVMDYSLLVGVDEQNHELVLGIIDFMRQYTWDKHLEAWVKASDRTLRHSNLSFIDIILFGVILQNIKGKYYMAEEGLRTIQDYQKMQKQGN
ncbi:hypothetical protein Tco_1232513 [Tanacetum coccineum]